MTRIAAALVVLSSLLFGGVLPAFAQAPAPVPALPDTERRTSYTISAQTGPFDVGFQIYGDSTDYGNWLEVRLDGLILTPVTDWTLALTSGTIATAARPITNAQVTLTIARTGLLEIIGARRPRRLSQFNENQGVSARSLNQTITDIVAQNRENWDKLNRVASGIPTNANDCLQINRTGLTDKAACERAPLFIWNDAHSSGNPAGRNMACQFWVGANPTATPGANQSQICTMYIDNNNRSFLFGLNIVVGAYDFGSPEWADTTISALEVEVHNFFAANAGTDPFGSSATRKNGISVTTGFMTVGRATAAFHNWGAERSGAGWVDTAFASSSAYNYGWRCIANPGGDPDLTDAFKTACLSDESNSATVLKATGGTHAHGVDLSGATFTTDAFLSNNFTVTPTGQVLAFYLQTYPKTVSTLATCNAGARGVISYVTDSNATLTAGIGAIVAGSGANVVPVFCDGTNWRIF